MLQIWDGKLSLEVAKDIHMTAPAFASGYIGITNMVLPVLLILGIAIGKATSHRSRKKQ